MDGLNILNAFLTSALDDPRIGSGFVTLFVSRGGFVRLFKSWAFFAGAIRRLGRFMGSDRSAKLQVAGAIPW